MYVNVKAVSYYAYYNALVLVLCCRISTSIHSHLNGSFIVAYFYGPALINCPGTILQSSELRYTANTQLEHRKLPNLVVVMFNILILSFSPRSLHRHG